MLRSGTDETCSEFDSTTSPDLVRGRKPLYEAKPLTPPVCERIKSPSRISDRNPQP